MGAVQVIESGRHPAVLDVPAGVLSIPTAESGEIKLSLVIPTFNESKNLEQLVARLSCVLDECLRTTRAHEAPAHFLPLKLAADECVKATFFPIGKHAIWHPEILKQVAAAGHSIGTHTWSHADLSKKSPDRSPTK